MNTSKIARWVNWRVTFTCAPYHATNHYIFIKAADKVDKTEIKRFVYSKKKIDELSVDKIIEVKLVTHKVDEPDFILPRTPRPSSRYGRREI